MPEIRRQIALKQLELNVESLVPARIMRNCPASILDVVEEQWTEARQSTAELADLFAADRMQHTHWNWRNKRDRVLGGQFGLMAVECGGVIQGMLAHLQEPVRAQLVDGFAVYVDYLETAPWNLRFSDRPARFGGVGSALLVESIRLSFEWGLLGRVGLHSLGQAEQYYERIGMIRLGADPDYYDLTRFEFPDDAALVRRVREELT